MSSTVSVTPLAVEIRPSRWLARYVVSVYSVAGLIIMQLPLSPWDLIVALCGLLLSGAVTYHRRVGLRGRSAVVAINRRVDGIWCLRQTDGVSHQAKLLPDSFLHPELLVLNFRLGNGRRRYVVLARDSSGVNSLRRLRAMLALGKSESP